MRTLEQGDLQDFSALQCAISGVLGDRGPDCLQFDNELLPCDFGLIFHLSHDHPHPTSKDLAWSSRPMVTDSLFISVFLMGRPFSPDSLCMLVFPNLAGEAGTFSVDR